MIVKVSRCERSNVFVVQRIWGGSSCFYNIPFIKFELNFPGDKLLCGFNKCLNGLTQRTKPFALVYDLGKPVSHIHFHRIRIPVENQLF